MKSNNTNKFKLQDYNECAGENGGNNCAATATCLNIPGSFSCTCNSEYFGSGVVCIRIFSFLLFFSF